MAGNKKPRHKRKVKTLFSPCRIRQEDIDKIQGDFQKFELVCELKLPMGNCTEDDMRCLKDWFNLMKMIILFPEERFWLNDCVTEAADTVGIEGIDVVQEIVPLCCEASSAVADVLNRGIESGSFVCKADELNAIRDFAIYAGPIVHKSFELCPRRTIKEYLAMRDLIGNKVGKVTLTMGAVKQALAKYL